MFNLKNLIPKLQKSAKKRGDTILEVVVATAILSSILVATFDILQRALDTNINVKNRVIALNIAREGIEAVRNVRDTNWLKYSGDRRNKWLCHDTDTAPDNCDADNFNPPGDLINDYIEDDAVATKGPYYVVDFDTGDNRYYLADPPPTLQSEINFLDTGQNLTREDYRLYLTPSAPQRYTHTSTGNAETIFYRQIYLDIENPYNIDPLEPNYVGLRTFCNETPAEDSCMKARLKVISKVYWQEDGRSRVTTLETHLFDFFERDDY